VEKIKKENYFSKFNMHRGVIRMILSMKYTKGFTLIELIVVISIMAILAAIAVLNYIGYVKETNETVCRVVFRWKECMNYIWKWIE
jgi:prepilin-type N-terminal cleavage/methylation domain-containing protein